jgi:hypothetical protein
MVDAGCVGWVRWDGSIFLIFVTGFDKVQTCQVERESHHPKVSFTVWHSRNQKKTKKAFRP